MYTKINHFYEYLFNIVHYFNANDLIQTLITTLKNNKIMPTKAI